MTRWTCIGVLSILSLVGTRVHAQSSVTIDNVKVSDTGLGTWTMVVSGKLTLGKDHTFAGVSFEFKSPTGIPVIPKITKYTQPKPGETTEYTYETNSSAKGEWTATTTLNYIANMKSAAAAVSKKFDVP